MEQLQPGRGISYISAGKNNLQEYVKNTLLILCMMSPMATQAQDVQVTINPVPMTGIHIKTQEMMVGANIELMSIGYDTWRLGSGINPAVYFDKKMSGKLGPSIQLTKKFDTGAEIRAIVGSHGGTLFVGVGGKVTIGGKKELRDSIYGYLKKSSP